MFNSLQMKSSWKVLKADLVRIEGCQFSSEEALGFRSSIQKDLNKLCKLALETKAGNEAAVKALDAGRVSFAVGFDYRGLHLYLPKETVTVRSHEELVQQNEPMLKLMNKITMAAKARGFAFESSSTPRFKAWKTKINWEKYEGKPFHTLLEDTEIKGKQYKKGQLVPYKPKYEDAFLEISGDDISEVEEQGFGVSPIDGHGEQFLREYQYRKVFQNSLDSMNKKSESSEMNPIVVKLSGKIKAKLQSFSKIFPSSFQVFEEMFHTLIPTFKELSEAKKHKNYEQIALCLSTIAVTLSAMGIFILDMIKVAKKTVQSSHAICYIKTHLILPWIALSMYVVGALSALYKAVQYYQIRKDLKRIIDENGKGSILAAKEVVLNLRGRIHLSKVEFEKAQLEVSEKADGLFKGIQDSLSRKWQKFTLRTDLKVSSELDEMLLSLDEKWILKAIDEANSSYIEGVFEAISKIQSNINMNLLGNMAAFLLNSFGAIFALVDALHTGGLVNSTLQAVGYALSSVATLFLESRIFRQKVVEIGKKKFNEVSKEVHEIVEGVKALWTGFIQKLPKSFPDRLKMADEKLQKFSDKLPKDFTKTKVALWFIRGGIYTLRLYMQAKQSEEKHKEEVEEEQREIG